MHWHSKEVISKMMEWKARGGEKKHDNTAINWKTHPSYLKTDRLPTSRLPHWLQNVFYVVAAFSVTRKRWAKETRFSLTFNVKAANHEDDPRFPRDVPLRSGISWAGRHSIAILYSSSSSVRRAARLPSTNSSSTAVLLLLLLGLLCNSQVCIRISFATGRTCGEGDVGHGTYDPVDWGGGGWVVGWPLLWFDCIREPQPQRRQRLPSDSPKFSDGMCLWHLHCHSKRCHWRYQNSRIVCGRGRVSRCELNQIISRLEGSKY